MRGGGGRVLGVARQSSMSACVVVTVRMEVGDRGGGVELGWRVEAASEVELGG